MRAWLGCFVVVLAACGGNDDAGAPQPTTSVTATARTEGTGAVFTLPSPPTTPPVTTTTLHLGLPEHFPVLPDGMLTLGPGSSIEQRLDVFGVDLAGVHDWLVQGLADRGYVVTADTGVQVEFVGTTAGGTAELSELAGEPAGVGVRVVMGSP